MTRPAMVWGPAVLLMVLIFGFSSLRDVPVPLGGTRDVAAHAIIYGGLGILMVRALAGAQRRGVTPRTMASALVLTALYGLTDEYHQSFVPGRFADFRDVLADVVGAGIGTGLVWAWSIVSSMGDQKRHDDV